MRKARRATRFRKEEIDSKEINGIADKLNKTSKELGKLLFEKSTA